MKRITLMLADAIRDRWKEFDFKSREEKVLVKKFLSPILMLAKEEEIALSKRLVASFEKAKLDAKIETENLRKELKAMKKSFDKLGR